MRVLAIVTALSCVVTAFGADRLTARRHPVGSAG